MRIRALPFGILSLVLAGCASYRIQPVGSTERDPWNEGAPEKGFVFYQPELYFLIVPPGGSASDSGSDKNSSTAPGAKAGANSGFSVTPIYLPNPQKSYRLTTFNFLAKSDFSFNFKDGWQLTSISDKADNTTVASTIAGELKTILSAAGAPGVAFLQPGQAPASSFLLHPRYDDTGIIRGFDVVPLPAAAGK